MQSQFLLVVDTETTGLVRLKLETRARPISFAAIAYRLEGKQLDKLGELYFLIRPAMWNPGEQEVSERIHGISYAQVMQTGVPYREAFDQFVNWTANLKNQAKPEDPTLYRLAWNSSFDQKMIDLWRNDYAGVKKPFAVWPTWCYGPLVAQKGCLLNLYRSWTKSQEEYYVPGQSFKLVDVAEQLLGKRDVNAHNALVDAQLAGDIFSHIIGSTNF